jgi:hypothetical protein
LAQFRIERNLGSPLAFSIIQESFFDLGGEHFLEAESLGTELDSIAVVFFGPAPFVFDRDDRAASMKLDDVGLPAQTELQRAERQATGDADAGYGCGMRLVGFAMQMLALHGPQVFGPQTFDVDQGALSLAEDQVLEGRNR